MVPESPDEALVWARMTHGTTQTDLGTMLKTLLGGVPSGTALGTDLGPMFGASPGAPKNRPGATAANARKEKKNQAKN